MDNQPFCADALLLFLTEGTSSITNMIVCNKKEVHWIRLQLSCKLTIHNNYKTWHVITHKRIETMCDEPYLPKKHCWNGSFHHDFDVQYF